MLTTPAPGSPGASPFKIFLSSPGDVAPERELVERVVNRMNSELPDAPRFELVRWEDDYYTANETFQKQIERPSECDLVICIFWKRLGTELPKAFQRPDGTHPTGTEFEFEDALQGAAASPDKTPDVLVYKKSAPVSFAEDRLELELEQRQRFLTFWRRWFHSEQGHFVAGFQSFDTPETFEEQVEDHLRQWLEKRAGAPAWTQGPPYRGLKPYDVEHAPIFFGRRREVERARARLIANAIGGTRFLLIHGPSGSGKSSLARAGLIARLGDPTGLSGVADTLRWAAVTPAGLTAADPAAWPAALAEALFQDNALAAALRAGDFDAPEHLAALIARDGEMAAAPVRKALARAAGDADVKTAALVLLVDQLEELFSWNVGDAVRFLEFLERLTAEAPGDATPGNPILAVATMRSDFLHRIGEFAALERLVGARALLGPEDHARTLEIGAPSPADFREMIAGPARVSGLTFEAGSAQTRGLQERLEEEAAPDALPALQFLLAELYRRRRGGEMTLEAHRALGGVTGVMATRGEAVLEDLGLETHAAAFQRVMRALITATGDDGPATARSVPRGRYAPNSRETQVLDAFVESGLLSSDRGVVKIAHESLIRGWDRLARQIAEERRAYEARDRLTQLLIRYEESASDPPAARRKRLLVGLPLAEGEDLLEKWGPDGLSDAAPGLPEFIRRSSAWRRARRRRTTGAVAAAAALLTLTGGAAFVFQQASEEAARTAEARLHVSRSETALRLGDLERAVADAQAAVSARDTPETRSALLGALSETSAHLQAVYDGAGQAATFLDGAATVVDGAGGALRPEGDAPAVAAAPPENSTLRNPALLVAPDAAGGLVALRADGAVTISGRTAPAPSNAEFYLSFRHQAAAAVVEGRDADGVWVGLADSFAGAFLRRCAASAAACSDRPLSGAPASAIAFSAKATGDAPSLIAVAHVGDAAPELAIYTPEGDRLGAMALDDLGAAGDALSLAWAHGAPLLAVGGRSGSVALIDVAAPDAPRLLSTTPVSEGPVTALAWAPTGARLAINCDTRDICIHDAAQPQTLSPPTRLHGHRAAIATLAWSQDGDRLVSAASNGTVRVWTLAPDRRVVASLPETGAGRLTALAADPARSRIAAGDQAGDVWIWPLAGGGPQRLPPPVDDLGPVRHMAFAPDGALAALHTRGAAQIRTPDLNAPAQTIRFDDRPERLAWIADGARLAAPSASARTISVVSRTGERRDFSFKTAPELRPEGVVAAPGLGGWITSQTDGSLASWSFDDGAAGLLISADVVADPASALSMSLHPTGRWLAATRSDDLLKLYDLEGENAPLALDVFRRDTKVVAFSPSGARLAALGSDNRLYLWRVNPATGTPVLTATALATPSTAKAGRMTSTARRAAWIAWTDDETLAIATIAGDVLTLNVNENDWTARAAALLKSIPPR